MRNFPKLWWLLLKLSFPLTLVMYPVAAVVGSFGVWPPAQEALASFPKDTPVLVGFSYKATYSSSGSQRRSSRSYVLFPSVLRNPTAITVQQINDAAPVVTQSVGPVVFLVVAYLVGIIGTWWFWLRGGATQQGIQADAASPRHLT